MTVSVYLSDMLMGEIILELNEHTRKDIYLIYTGLQVSAGTMESCPYFIIYVYFFFNIIAVICSRSNIRTVVLIKIN